MHVQPFFCEPFAGEPFGGEAFTSHPVGGSFELLRIRVSSLVVQVKFEFFTQKNLTE